MVWEILIGIAVAVVFILAAILWAIRPTGGFGPRRHDVRGGGDYADPASRGRGWGDGSDGGGDGGGGD